MTRPRTESKPAANKGFSIAKMHCFAEALVQGGGSVLRMRVNAKTIRNRKPQKTI